MFFTAVLPAGAQLKAEESEVSGFEWVDVKSAEDVEKIPLAFVSAKNTLLKWLETK